MEFFYFAAGAAAPQIVAAAPLKSTGGSVTFKWFALVSLDTSTAVRNLSTAQEELDSWVAST